MFYQSVAHQLVSFVLRLKLKRVKMCIIIKRFKRFLCFAPRHFCISTSHISTDGLKFSSPKKGNKNSFRACVLKLTEIKSLKLAWYDSKREVLIVGSHAEWWNFDETNQLSQSYGSSKNTSWEQSRGELSALRSPVISTPCRFCEAGILPNYTTRNKIPTLVSGSQK